MNDATKHHIIRPAYADREAIATLIADAYADLPAARWLVPEAEHRAGILRGYHAIVIEHAFFYGHIDVTADRRAVAVWLHHTEHVPPPYEYSRRLRDACGPYAYRFEQLDELTRVRRPRSWHHHLALLAVAPDARRAGRGRALLTHHHARLDEIAIPAYLEAPSPRLRAICLRQGYHPSVPFTLPNNAAFWPMWRHPRWLMSPPPLALMSPPPLVLINARRWHPALGSAPGTGQDLSVGANLSAELAVVALVSALAAALYAVVRLRARRGIATATQRATYDVLHTAGLAAEPLRAGLTTASAAKAVRHLRTLVGAAGLALVDSGRQTGGDQAADGGQVLALDGRGAHHSAQFIAAAQRAVRAGRSTVLGEAELPCDRVDCAVRGAVVAPLRGPDGQLTGALVAVADDQPAPGLVQATLETAHWVGTQLALAELDSSRERLAQAEVRALRAQISPHFIYNALTAIASFVRTDPERARELILEFAEFTRYSFRAHGEFTTLAEELRSIDRYLTIERARFGDRLQVRLQIAPEVLPVSVPFLCLQPLVENAVRHGLSRKPGVGMVSIHARDAGAECHITVEDDGVGMDPAVLAASLAESPPDAADDSGQHVGLSNVDERLRSVFGDQFGLVVETGLGSGTKISMRVPKFHRGVRAAS